MDARVRYTRRVIREAFLELMGEKNADRINVKEICDMAQINRTTFYKHYENIYDLLEKLENEMMDELVAKIREVELDDLRSIFKIIFTEVKENRNYYELVILEKGERRFRDSIFNMCLVRNMEVIDECFPLLNETHKKWLYYFVAEGLAGVMSRWMSEGYNESIDEVVDFMSTLIESVNNTMQLRPDEDN